MSELFDPPPPGRQKFLWCEDLVKILGYLRWHDAVFAKLLWRVRRVEKAGAFGWFPPDTLPRSAISATANADDARALAAVLDAELGLVERGEAGGGWYTPLPAEWCSVDKAEDWFGRCPGNA